MARSIAPSELRSCGFEGPVEFGDHLVRDLGAVRGPALDRGPALLGRGLGDVAQPHLGAGLLGGLGGALGERVHAAVGGVVDDRDLGHAETPGGVEE